MKRALFGIVAVLVLFFSCDSNSGSDFSYAINDVTTVTGIVTAFDAASPATTAVPSGNTYVAGTPARSVLTQDSGYQTYMAAITNKITVDLSNESSWDSSIVRDGELVTITTTNSVEIEIEGATNKKTAFLLMNAKSKPIILTFNNAKFSSEKYPCVESDKNTKVYIVAKGNSVLTDGRKYGTDYKAAGGAKTKGSVYLKGQIVLCGDGSFALNESYKHGFYSTDYIRVASGKWKVNTSGRNAIQTQNAFMMDGGELEINGTGNHLNNESRGIVVEGLDAETGKKGTTVNENPGEGFVSIRDGKLKIRTVDSAIVAKWDFKDDAVTAQTTDDPFPYVMVSGGTLDITTTGTPKDKTSSKITFTDADGEEVSEKIKLHPEGISARQAVVITGGNISINSTDNGINASNDNAWVSISGGNIYIVSSKNDAIDSNGNMYISGGVVVAYGLTEQECAFDCNKNSFEITGGLLLGVGTHKITEPNASKTTKGTFILTGDKYAAGTLAVLDSSDDVVFAYDIPLRVANNESFVLMLSSPKIEAGSYTVKTLATASGGEKFHNLYTTLPTISAGKTVTTFETAANDFVKKYGSIQN